jgi:hypothetical protein
MDKKKESDIILEYWWDNPLDLFPAKKELPMLASIEKEHQCFICNVTFVPRNDAYGNPEEVITTLYEYGCKPVCYACYDSLLKESIITKTIKKVKNFFSKMVG